MRKWAIFSVIYFSCVVAIMNQFKVPPVMGILMGQFHVDTVVAGLLMSLFSVTGIILAFPGAAFLKRIGAKRSGMVALGCIVLGCVVGALSPGPSNLMAGRVIEGIGLALIGVIAPAVVAMIFDRDEVGLPMGILATWFPVGSAIAFNISHPIVQAFGSWKASWWFGGALALIAFILFDIVVSVPQRGKAGYGHRGRSVSYSEGLKNPKIWLLGLTFFFTILGGLGFLTWAPKYFMDVFGMNMGTANFTASIGFMWSAPGGIIAGIMFNKIKGNKDIIIVICAVLATLAYTPGFLVSLQYMYVLLAAIGLVTGYLCGTIWAMVPGIMTFPAFIPLGMSVIALMQGLSNFLAAPLWGYFVDGNNWTKAVMPTAVIQILGVICAIAFVRTKRYGHRYF
ncbi:CynX/NimT family MFS transporter [Desulfosporosinus fructosivorans]|nr:MFS transporter [Desulfosporosinus fructosivorans]